MNYWREQGYLDTKNGETTANAPRGRDCTEEACDAYYEGVEVAEMENVRLSRDMTIFRGEKVIAERTKR